AHGVSRRPHVERRERVDDARVADRVAGRHLGPGTDANTLGLNDPAVEDVLVGRLTVGPDTLFERTTQFRLVRLTHQVGALMIEARVQEEPRVIEFEAVSSVAATLAEGEQLLTFGERTNRNRPFLECNWHKERGIGDTDSASTKRHAAGGRH